MHSKYEEASPVLTKKLMSDIKSNILFILLLVLLPMNNRRTNMKSFLEEVRSTRTAGNQPNHKPQRPAFSQYFPQPQNNQNIPTGNQMGYYYNNSTNLLNSQSQSNFFSQPQSINRHGHFNQLQSNQFSNH